jgi:predicted DsbA family dithiol-disulfide isomerase
VISDVICPWCYSGKRRLEKAVATLDRQHEVRLRWLPFQLNLQMPKEGINRRDYRTAEFGSWERALELGWAGRGVIPEAPAQLHGGVRALQAPVNTLESNGAYMVMTALAWNLKAWWALLRHRRGSFPGPLP